MLHLTSSGWGWASLDLSAWSTFLGRFDETSTLQWSISSQKLGVVVTILLSMDDSLTFVGDKVAVWPVSTLKLGENKETFVADFESSDSWDLLEIWSVLIFIWNQIVVKIEWQVGLGDLVLHDDGIWDSIDDSSGDSLEEIVVLGLIMTSMPSVLMTVLSAFNNEYNFRRVHL